MIKEYDLTNELGPKNWLDCVAGEAVVQGHRMNLPELVAAGTCLSKMIRETSFFDDGFGKVIAYGKELERRLREEKREFEKIEFIDDLFVGPEKDKSCVDWEYMFIYAQRRYQIMMMMPEYYGRCPNWDLVKEKADESIRGVLDDPGLTTYQRVETKAMNGEQEFVTVVYLDRSGNEVFKAVDFNHEGEIKRGRIETYYFDHKSQAEEAWLGVKDAFISGRRR